MEGFLPVLLRMSLTGALTVLAPFTTWVLAPLKLLFRPYCT